MFDILKQTKSALFSLFFMILGSGLLMTLLPLRLHWQHESVIIIGGLTTAYYAGLIIGSFKVESIIIRIGHIRAFAASASFLAIICMLHGIWENAWFWLGLRLLGGIATATLYVVIESWLLAKGTLKTRGQILSFYMITLYGAQSASQFLLDVGNQHSIIPFCIVSMLTMLSVIPLAMTKAVTPEISEPSTLKLTRLYNISPTGFVGSFIAGLLLSAIYGLMPIMLEHAHFAVKHIAIMMAVIIFGGMLLQYPIGRLSDTFERRFVMLIVCIVMIIACLALIFTIREHLYWLQLFILFLLGGTSFTIYPLSISHACDHLQTKNIIAGTQGLLLIYSIGATLGPILAAIFMHPSIGQNGLMYYLILLCGLLSWFLLWRKATVPQTVDEEDQQHYITVPHTTPVASELDPRNEEK